AVLFPQFPILKSLWIERVRTAFSEDKILVRERLMHQLDVIEHRVAAGPRLIPMKTNSPDEPRGSGIRQDCACSLINQVAVVVPGDYFLVPQSRSLHRRAKIVFQEVSFIFS